MKNIKIALLAMLCMLSLGLYAQKPPFFTEGFETGSKPTAVPKRSIFSFFDAPFPVEAVSF